MSHPILAAKSRLNSSDPMDFHLPKSVAKSKQQSLRGAKKKSSAESADPFEAKLVAAKRKDAQNRTEKRKLADQELIKRFQENYARRKEAGDKTIDTAAAEAPKPCLAFLKTGLCNNVRFNF